MLIITCLAAGDRVFYISSGNKEKNPVDPVKEQ
jgi:hypothetical protein